MQRRNRAMDDAPPRGSETTGASDGRTLEQLRQAVRARDAFVAIAAHELRNPMTPILMQVHALLRAAADPKAAVPPGEAEPESKLSVMIVTAPAGRASSVKEARQARAGWRTGEFITGEGRERLGGGKD